MEIFKSIPSSEHHKQPCPGKMRHMGGENGRKSKGKGPWGGLQELLIEMGLLSRPHSHYTHKLSKPLIIDINQLPPPSEIIHNHGGKPRVEKFKVNDDDGSESNKGWVKVEEIDHTVKPFLWEDMKKHVEDMLKGSKEKGEKALEGFVPLLENDKVKILPFNPSSILPMVEVMTTVDGEEPKVPFRHWRHKRPHSFGGR